jgi:uncharacterized protein (TIGR02246 family)
MNRVFATAFVVLAASLSTPAEPASSSQNHPVESFFISGIAAFNAHDLDGFMKQFASDIEMYTPTGWVRGDQAVRERFADTFSKFPAVRMEIENLRVREVAAGTVVTDFEWRVYPMGQGPAFHGIGSGVYVRRDGRWVEVLEHETVVRVDEGLSGNRR